MIRTHRTGHAGRGALALLLPLVLFGKLACGSSDDTPAGVQPGTGGTGGATGGGGRGGAQQGGTSGTDGGDTGAAAADSSGGDGGSGNSGGEAGSVAGAAGEQASGGTGGGSGGTGATGGGGSGGDGATGGSAASGGSSGTAGSAPLGDELCGDGFDNDGDGDDDCDDDDCEEACASCDSVDAITDPTTIETTNVDRPAGPPSDCVATGPALIYEVVVETTGFLEVEAEGMPFVRTSILTGCDDTTTLSCGFGRATAPVTAGDRRFVRVAGVEPTDTGYFTLSVHSRAADVCGDGYRDPSEGCDDGGEEGGDGCDETCRVETSETEPNDTRETASEWAEPFYGEIDAGDDEDFLVFEIELEGRATLVAELTDLGDGACDDGALDSLLELYDASGDLLASDDDGGERYCSRVAFPDAETGQFYLRVTASPTGDTPSFPYRILVSTETE